MGSPGEVVQLVQLVQCFEMDNIEQVDGQVGSGLPSERYRLTAGDADRAHARPWSDAMVLRFQARHDRLVRHGFGNDDATDLAERLALRDGDADDRRMCAGECRHLSGRVGAFRCGNSSPAGLVGDRSIGTDLAVMLQRCGGFAKGDRG